MGMNGGTTYDRGDWVGMIEAFTHAQIREQKRIADALEVLAGARKAEEDMNEFIAGLGLEPSFVSSVTIRPWVDGWWVEAEVVAHDENGRVVYGEDADEPRVDTIEFGVSA